MSLIVDISGLDDGECHNQCQWQRVTEFVCYFYLSMLWWRRGWWWPFPGSCCSYFMLASKLNKNRLGHVQAVIGQVGTIFGLFSSL